MDIAKLPKDVRRLILRHLCDIRRAEHYVVVRECMGQLYSESLKQRHGPWYRLQLPGGDYYLIYMIDRRRYCINRSGHRATVPSGNQFVKLVAGELCSLASLNNPFQINVTLWTWVSVPNNVEGSFLYVDQYENHSENIPGRRCQQGCIIG